MQLSYSIAKESFLTRINLAFALTVLVILYVSLGIFQFVPVENDSMRIAVGMQGTMLYGNNVYSYFYDLQAGTFALAGAVSNGLKLNAFDAFSLLTAISSIFFLCTSAYFLKRTVKTTFLTSLLALLLFQETWVSGYYPNSSMVAAAFLAAALLLATWQDELPLTALAGLCFALSVWSRFDAIAVGGAFLVLYARPSKKALVSLGVFAVTFAVTILFLVLASGVSLSGVNAVYSTYRDVYRDIAATANSYSSIFTLAVLFFIGVGIYLLVKAKQWRLIALACLAPLPLIYAYGLALDSPKKFLYAMPLLAIPIAYSFKVLVSAPRTKVVQGGLLVGAILIAGQYFFTPPFELLQSRSMIVPTSDQVRFRGAIAFTPIYWVEEKLHMGVVDADFQNMLAQYVGKHDDACIIAHDWMANQWVLYQLHSMNYRIIQEQHVTDVLENGQILTLEQNQHHVCLIRWQPEKPLTLPESWKTEIRQMSSVLYVGADRAYAGPVDPAVLTKDSVIVQVFHCRQWDPSVRFWTMECSQ